MNEVSSGDTTMPLTDLDEDKISLFERDHTLNTHETGEHLFVVENVRLWLSTRIILTAMAGTTAASDRGGRGTGIIRKHHQKGGKKRAQRNANYVWEHVRRQFLSIDNRLRIDKITKTNYTHAE